MAALSSAPFVVVLACSWIFVLCKEQQEVTAKPGEDVTLQCRGPREADITVIKWTRTDLKPDYIFFFRENRSYESYQHPSYRGRVELRDPEMKDGDASVVLKNVNINDAGTYECRVSTRAAPHLFSTIRLTVTDSGLTAGQEGGDEEGGDKDGNVGLIVGPSVVVLLLVVVVGFLIFRKRNGRTENNLYQPTRVDLKCHHIQ